MTPTEARDYCDDLIDQLRCERERQGVSQEEIMERGGPTPSCQWEIGGGGKGRKWGPATPTVIAYADALGYDVRLVKRERKVAGNLG